MSAGSASSARPSSARRSELALQPVVHDSGAEGDEDGELGRRQRRPGALGHLGLGERAREAVQHVALLAGPAVMGERGGHDLEHEVVGHQLAAVDEVGHAAAELGSRCHLGPQHVAGGDVGHP